MDANKSRQESPRDHSIDILCTIGIYAREYALAVHQLEAIKEITSDPVQLRVAKNNIRRRNIELKDVIGKIGLSASKFLLEESNRIKKLEK